MQKTYKELQEIDEVVAAIYQRNPEVRKGKFGYAYNRFYSKNIKPIIEEISEKLTDIRVENAMVDEKTKELVYDNTNGQKLYKYTKEGMIKMLSEQRKINKEYDKKKVEIIPFITKDIPEDIMEEEKEALKGCLING